MTDKTYQDGVRDGRITATENILGKQEKRLDSHSSRIRSVERATWIMLGVVFTINAFPAIRDALRSLTN